MAIRKLVIEVPVNEELDQEAVNAFTDDFVASLYAQNKELGDMFDYKNVKVAYLVEE